MTSAALSRDPSLYTTLRPRKSRTRSGCLACRARRKKCDERRPVCRACQRLQTDCSWSKATSADEELNTEEPSIRGAQTSQGSILTPATRGSNTTTISSLPPTDSDNLDTLGLSAEDLMQELQDLEARLRDRGILDSVASVVPEFQQQIQRAKGPEAANVFAHFCEYTAPWLINGPGHQNPVLKHVVPLAIKDELVLNTVLAASGHHLAYGTSTNEAVSTKYYSYALRMLGQRLSNWMSETDNDYKPLFAAVVLLCHCELIQGNAYGTALRHLRACREFVDAAMNHLQDPEDQDLVVFLVEHYGYFMLISSLRHSPQQDNLRLGLEFASDIMPRIKDLPTFGSMLMYEPKSIALIPRICYLAAQRNANSYASDDIQSHATYMALLDDLGDERNELGMLDPTAQLHDTGVLDAKRVVISIKVNTLLLISHAAFHGYGPDRSWMLNLLQPLIDHTMLLLAHVDEDDFCYGLFWSIVVTGSFIRNADTQALLVRKLQTNQSGMPFFKQGVEILQWLWSIDGTEENGVSFDFGLAGLEKVATAHGVDVGLC